MASIRLITYSTTRKVWCERCGKARSSKYDYGVPMRGSTKAVVIEALVCRPCANAVRALGELDLPAFYERLHI